ncbi:MAG TPA: NAD(P)-dependent alcohol dehydrogenase [bacterium]|nr:NAD(P)-dependent alcohol dehydrogenase [bacterium]
MRAIVYRAYGAPDVLKLETIATPVPRDDELLIKVHAASVNAWDWGLLRGTPFINRLGGLFKPRYPVLGADVAGRVESVGRSVTRFKPGDAVFGDLSACGWGGFAEYVCAPESSLARKPDSMSFEQAAAIPQAGAMALQGLRDQGRIQPGQRVLINGAGGGVGTFAVQIAKAFRANVTGVDSAGKLALMAEIGADQVIDYTRDDFTQSGQRYDRILDVAAYHSMLDCARALNPGGIYVLIGGSLALAFQLLFLGPLISLALGKRMGVLPAKSNQGLDVLIGLCEAGKVKSVIDRRYPLEQVPEALRYLGGGFAQGKVLIAPMAN